MMARPRTRDWDDPAVVRAYHRAYYAANREKLRAQARPNDREVRLWSNYRLSPDQYDRMVEDQQGLCYLCGEPLDFEGDSRAVCVDHDHGCCRGSRSCGACIRGLACHGCNKSIGYCADDPDRMRRVADNLEMANRRVRETSNRQPVLFVPAETERTGE